MPCLADAPMDVVILLLDDGRFDQLGYLAETMKRLAPTAVTWERAYVTVPMCCPERASFLSGGWTPPHTGVLANEGLDGGAQAFPDERTLAVRLQEAGYATALLGKYLNGYEELGLYVPPGWDTWEVVTAGTDWSRFDYTAGSSGPDGPATAETRSFPGYVTDWQEGEALAFLDAHPTEPVFLLLSFRAPHDPHTPAPEDQDAYAGFEYRGRAWQEDDVSDKPAWVADTPPLTTQEVAALDEANEERLESLLSTDRAMAAVLDGLAARGRTDRTLVVLTSDNGQLWGEHRLVDKGFGYEESIRVPLVVSHPGLSPRSDQRLVATNLDLAATVQEVAGLPVEGMGQALSGPLCDPELPTRTGVVSQSWTEGLGPYWTSLVTADWKLIVNAAGERELYDLVADPYELESLDGDSDQAGRIADLEAELREGRGFASITAEVPAGQAGVPYTTRLEAWGGAATWRLDGAQLPASFVLSPAGLLTGTPPSSGSFRFQAVATSDELSGYTGLPIEHARSFTLEVAAAPEGTGCGCAAPTPWVPLGLLLSVGLIRRSPPAPGGNPAMVPGPCSRS